MRLPYYLRNITVLYLLHIIIYSFLFFLLAFGILIGKLKYQKFIRYEIKLYYVELNDSNNS